MIIYKYRDAAQPMKNNIFYDSNVSMYSGTSFSRYNHDFIQKECLGKGSFGAVYKCINKVDGMAYAIKFSQKHFRGESEKNSAIQEAFALSALSVYDDIPNIIRYYSTWIEEEKLYIAMELCETSLTKISESKTTRFEEKHLKHIMRDICLGLAKLHEYDIVHLDIKPENILYKNERFKISDLGLASIISMCDKDIPEGDSR